MRGAQPSNVVSINAILPCSEGGSLGVLPNPVELASLQLPTILVEEAGSSIQAVSESMGNPNGKGASSAPHREGRDQPQPCYTGLFVYSCVDYTLYIC